jgi:hypothetical protein
MPSKRLSHARERARASWIFSSVLLAVLIALVWFAPERLAGFKQQIVAVLAALLAGLMAYFLTGDLGIQKTWMKASGGMGAFALMLFLWPKLVPTPGPELYRLRVTVLGPQGQLAEDAEVRSSVGGEKKKVDGGWELDIPAGVLPAERKVTVYAERISAFLHGSREVVLDKDFQPVVTIELREDRSAVVTGNVQDEEGHALSGARVNVAGSEVEAVTTGTGGGFSLAAHAAPGQIVQLHAEKQGFRPIDQAHPAAKGPATLILERQ